MKKLLFISLGMLIPALSSANWTFCDNCCYLPDDKTRYVNWTNNKMFIDDGNIKASVDSNSSLLLGNGGTTEVRTAGLNTVPNDRLRVMDFENTPEWDVTFVEISGIPVPVYTLTHWNVQSFGFLTVHDADVTPDQVKFRTRAGGWEVDPLRLPYPPNCAADESKGNDAVDWWWVPQCFGTPNRSASLEIATSLGAVSFRYTHESSGVCWAVAAIGGI